ncbi:ATP-binding protein [Methylobacterium brachiatum]|uniref:ATP-binding protein n=1 Tax=Methylobacterium brachiatum TaxID=269660 RepID=UPI0008E379B5|nr:ATP-binding protein [Methylobacterium brachiatum]SFI46178.1 AAA-like domain-containing protein [Methylobacterium brachiatum]
MTDALDALRRVDFDWVRTLDSVWTEAEPTGGPNEALVPLLVAEMHDEARTAGQRAPARVLVGQAGIGKTHLVGQFRHAVWNSGGWFVLLDVLGLTDFWRSAALSYLTALLQTMPDGRRQSDAVLAGVARRFKVEAQVEAAFNTPNMDTRRIVDLLVMALMKVDAARALQHQDVFRALCLLRAQDLGTIGLAHAWLQGYDADPAERAALGFKTPPPAPVDLVRGMAWIMGLGGPTLVALDQIDGVIDASRLAATDDLDATVSLTEVLAAGILELHEVGGRGMTLISCLPDSWSRLEERGLKSFRHRLKPPIALQGMNDKVAAAALIRGRLAPAYRAAGFVPPHPEWPFSPAAIAAAAEAGMMPRTLLMRCDAVRRACLARGTVEVCHDLLHTETGQAKAPLENEFDLDAARTRAGIDGLLDDEGGLGDLLRAAFDLYALEDDPEDALDVASKGEPEQRIPPLHGRLTFIHRDENDRERHVCYRALQHQNAIAFQARLRAALTASGISTRIPDRELLIVRRGPVPGGDKTRHLVDTFKAAGGLLIDPDEADLRTFVALRDLKAKADAEDRRDRFEAWLRAQKPVRATALFHQAGLAEPTQKIDGRHEFEVPSRMSDATLPLPPPSAGEGGPRRGSGEGQRDDGGFHSRRDVSTSVAPLSRPLLTQEPPSPTEGGGRPPVAAEGLSSSRTPSAPEAIPVGRRINADAQPVTLPIRLLPRHTAIIAGSGSGKTVLLRRLVEEAALAGIPAIVIDPNNDLSRLGDSWPERPAAFTDADAAQAAAYAERVEVVVWTPGVNAGNPLFLSVLPDFSGIGADPDERQQAVEMAAETLGPLAGARKGLQRGVLADALRVFAERGGGSLGDFITLLADLPDGVSDIGEAAKHAAKMADELRAAVATNPLLRVKGAVLDPKLLFFGADPARTRISVINLSGLGSEAAREDFVNRLQMTLFGWIKRNPSPRGMLYVVDEAQTFLPAQRASPSLGSGIKLVAQGRKYGLGLVVATQVPKGLHNQIVSNCTTQFFGRQSAPATIAAAQEIMAAHGGAASDIGRLGAGEFYFATEGSGRPAKLTTPLCLSYHPANPPTPEQVVAAARRSAGA